jgi:hypothetical protein
VPLLALSTENMVGLAVMAGVFIAFALVSSMVLPRYQPDYPGRGLPAFVIVSLILFFCMLAAVEVFGVEEEEGPEAAAVASVLPGTR